MLRKVLVPTLTLSLAVATAALAQDAGQAPATPERAERGPMRMFDRLDADDNGMVSTGEFGGERLEMLREADADGDGTLTHEELVTYVMNREFKRRAERAARLLDIDGDGTVTLAEIEDHQGKRFALLDRNNDGELSQGEVRRGRLGRHMMRMHAMDREGPRFAMRRGDHGPRHHKFMRRMHEMEPAAPTEE